MNIEITNGKNGPIRKCFSQDVANDRDVNAVLSRNCRDGWFWTVSVVFGSGIFTATPKRPKDDPDGKFNNGDFAEKCWRNGKWQPRRKLTERELIKIEQAMYFASGVRD